MENNYSYIDSLRGIAIIMVVLVHVGQSVSDLSPAVDFITRYGQLGVQLFFLVSAFSLSLSFDRRLTEPSATTKYFIRRYFRLAPLYYAGIVWYFFVRTVQESVPVRALVYPDRFDLTNIMSNVTLAHGLVPAANNSIVPGGWSVGTEALFYVLLPLLLFMVRRLMKNHVVSVFLLIVFSLVFALIVQGPEVFHEMDKEYGNFMYFNISNQLPVFVLGLATYVCYREWGFYRLSIYVSVILYVAFTAVTALLWKYHLSFSQTLVPFFAGLSFVFILILFSRVNALSGTLIRHIGKLSFSIYIVHFVFARVLGEVFSNLVNYGVPADLILVMHFVLTFSVSYVISIWTQKHIESRGVEAGRQLIVWLYGANDKKATASRV